MDQQSQPLSFLGSIERKVAFIVAPIMTVLGGLATQVASTGQLATTHAPGGSYALSGATALGIAAAFWKWLDGRSQFTQLVANAHNLERGIEPVFGELKAFEQSISPDERAKIIADVGNLLTSKGIATAVEINGVRMMLEGLHSKLDGLKQPMTFTGGGIGSGGSFTMNPPEPPVDPAAWVSPNDPAPSGGAPDAVAAQPVVGS